jgi:hypothetical protein
MAEYDDSVATVTLKDMGGDVQCVPVTLENVIIIFKTSGYTVVESDEVAGDEQT